MTGTCAYDIYDCVVDCFVRPIATLAVGHHRLDLEPHAPQIAIEAAEDNVISILCHTQITGGGSDEGGEGWRLEPIPASQWG